MDNKSNKPLNFTLWTAGIGIIILTLSSIIGKIREAIISEKKYFNNRFNFQYYNYENNFNVKFNFFSCL